MGIAMNISYRVHEWLADHVKWVQYPDISEANRTTQPRFRWKYAMPLHTRVSIGLTSLFFLIVLIGFLAVVLTVLGSFAVAVLGY